MIPIFEENVSLKFYWMFFIISHGVTCPLKTRNFLFIFRLSKMKQQLHLYRDCSVDVIHMQLWTEACAIQWCNVTWYITNNIHATNTSTNQYSNSNLPLMQSFHQYKPSNVTSVLLRQTCHRHECATDANMLLMQSFYQYKPSNVTSCANIISVPTL